MPDLSLEGHWRPVAAYVDGQVLPVGELRVARLLLERGGYRIMDCSERVLDSGQYRLDSSVSPWALDLIGLDGPGSGRTMLAIAALDGELLTVCYDLDGAVRPAAFASQEGLLVLMITYTRSSVQPRH